MKKRLEVLCIIGMIFVSVTSCRIPEKKETKVQSQDTIYNEVKEENNVFIIEADINHDGTKEKLTVTVDDGGAGEKILFSIADEKTEETIYLQTLYPQERNIAFYLYNDGKEDYLIKYQPQCEQGSSMYSYQVFYLDTSNEEIITDMQNVNFDTYYVTRNFDIEAMTDFYSKVNEYLENSILLFSCIDTPVLYSTEDNLISNREGYKFLEEYDIDYSDCKDISAKLSKYYDYVMKLELSSQA